MRNRLAEKSLSPQKEDHPSRMRILALQRKITAKRYKRSIVYWWGVIAMGVKMDTDGCR